MSDGDPEPEGVAEKLALAVTLLLGLASCVGVDVRVGDSLAPGVIVCVVVASCDGVPESVKLCVGVSDDPCEGDVVADGVEAAEDVALPEGDAADEPVAVELSVVLIVAVEERVAT